MNDFKAGWVLLASTLVGVSVAVFLWHRAPAQPRTPRVGVPEAAPRAVPWIGSERVWGVVEDDQGTPLAGVELVARPVDAVGDLRSARTRSGADGEFELAGLPAEPIQLEASAPFHERAVLPEVPLPATSPAPLRIVLPRTAELAGEVLDPGGTPAPGAAVTVAGSGLWPPRTIEADGSGRFRLSPLPAGVYEVRAGLGELTSDPQEGIIVEAGREAFVSIALIPGVSLRGRIHDAETGKAVPGARITIGEDALTAVPRELESDAEGRFELAGLRPLPHRLSIRADGFVALAGERRTPGERELTFPIRRAGVLTGTVVDARGEPIAGAELEVLGTTDVGGALHMSPAALRFQRDLFETRLFQHSVGQPGSGAIGATADNLGVTRGAVPKIPLIPGSGIALADAASGSVEESMLALRSDERGAFRVEGVPPGRVQVLARRAGFAPGRSAEHRLGSGETLTELRVELSRGGRLVGRVLDDRGFPVEAARVQLQLEGEPLGRVALSARDGRFSFDALRGSVVVTAHRHGSPSVRESAEVEAGQEVELELVFGGAARELSGRVLGTRGFPVPGAIVRVEALDARSPVSRTTTSGGDGSFGVRGLPEPPYRVRVEHSQYAPLELDTLALEDGEVTLQLTPGARLGGGVFDGWRDHPLAGARLELVAVDGAGRRRARSDTEGRFELRNLRHGHYLLVASHGGFVSGRREVHVSEDVEIERLDLTPAGGISGEVVDRFGAPVFNAQVAVGDPPAWDSRTESTRTDHRGRFRIAGLTEGEHLVHARHARAGENERALPARVYTLQETPGLVLRLSGDSARTSAGGGEGDDGRGTAAREGVAVRVAFRAGFVVVDEVVAGSRAGAAGMLRGDRLLSIDDEPVHVASQARAMLRGPAGTRVVVDVRRGQRVHRLLVTRELFAPP